MSLDQARRQPGRADSVNDANACQGHPPTSALSLSSRAALVDAGSASSYPSSSCLPIPRLRFAL